MTKRKITLCSIAGILLVIAIVQAIVLNKNPIKTAKLSAEPDSVTIKTAENTVLLKNNGSSWVVGDGSFEAKKSDIDTVLNLVREVKILDSVGKTGNEILEERYRLSDEKSIVVSVKKGENILRTILVGKTTSTSSQTYITLDGKKDILLVSGNYRSVFDKDENSFRSEYVYELDSNKISWVSCTTDGTSWKIENLAKVGEEAKWSFADSLSEKEIDNDKVENFVQSIATLKVNSWLLDSEVLPSKKAASVQFGIGNETVFVDVYSKNDGDSVKYFGTSNRSVHKFELSEYNAKKFIKYSDDFIKK